VSWPGACSYDRVMRWWLLVWVVGACSPDPCEPERLGSCSDCGPGQIRHGVRFGGYGWLDTHATTGGGVACEACDVIYTFDRRGNEVRAVAIENVVDIAVASSGEMYALTQFTPPYDIEFEERPASDWSLVALDDMGAERWRVALETTTISFYIKAAPEGPYAVKGSEFGGMLTAFDPNGVPRWSRELTDGFEPDGHGGVFVFKHVFEPHVASAQPAITLIDGVTGAERWNRTFTVYNDNLVYNAAMFVTAANTTPAGELVVGGAFEGISIDLGGRVLTTTMRMDGFVAAFDASGATRFAHTTGLGINAVAAVGDAVAIAGRYEREVGVLPPAGYEPDGYLALFDQAGAIRVHHVGGDSIRPLRLDDAGDGSVWASVYAQATDPDERELVLGSRRYGHASGGHTYLLNVTP
jgi:hypothetical protein